MHWFWRAAIACGCSYVLFLLLLQVADRIRLGFHYLIVGIFGFPENLYGFVNMGLPMMLMWVVALIPPVLLGIFVFHGVSRRIPDPETRCRKCQYILRGITEPRCPECGEKI